MNILYATESRPLKGNIRGRAFSEDSLFVVQYYNTEQKSTMQDLYSLEGKVIEKNCIVSEKDELRRFENGFSEGIPIGKNSPIGNYIIPSGLSTTYYSDSVLYALVGPSVPDKIKLPYLEIKEETKDKRRIELKWCKDSIEFSPERILVDENVIVGTTPMHGTDTLYIFQGQINGKDCFQYAPLGIPNDRAQTKTTIIKSYDGVNYLLWFDRSGYLVITYWNSKSINLVHKRLKMKIDRGIDSVDFSVISNRIFIIWNDIEDTTSPATSIIKTKIKML